MAVDRVTVAHWSRRVPERAARTRQPHSSLRTMRRNGRSTNLEPTPVQAILAPAGFIKPRGRAGSGRARNKRQGEDDMELNASVSAVVTGGASGLGAATARALAAQGVRVALFDLNVEKGEALARELGGVFCQVNVTSEAEVEAGFAKARAAIGQERILVNCAGTGNAIKTASRSKEAPDQIKHFPTDAFERIIQINLIGTFRCIARSAAGMLTLDSAGGERGVIINTASVAAQDGQMGQAAYSASKAGVVGMTLPIARDLAGEGIRVNTILPGIFNTPLLQGAAENVKAALAASVPFPKRLGQPEEFASLAVEMCRNGYFNGESVRLDGAIRMAPR
jgi:NAD(P)-dependent dehydrogenase (short-subunit alcohol dehydrogenase family)